MKVIESYRAVEVHAELMSKMRAFFLGVCAKMMRNDHSLACRFLRRESLTLLGDVGKMRLSRLYWFQSM